MKIQRHSFFLVGYKRQEGEEKGLSNVISPIHHQWFDDSSRQVSSPKETFSFDKNQRKLHRTSSILVYVNIRKAFLGKKNTHTRAH